MDVKEYKEYIESGVVELYAMNALSSEEKKEFERMVLLYPEILTELIRLEETMENYAQAHSVNPRPQLRGKVLKVITGANEIKKNGLLLNPLILPRISSHTSISLPLV